MIVQNSVTDFNALVIVFCLETDEVKDELKSIDLIEILMNHRGSGGLYQCLKGLNYIINFSFSINEELQSVFRMVTIDIRLSEKGLKNYQRVLALVFEYMKITRDNWLKGREKQREFHLFHETKLMNKLSYDIYDVPE